MTSTGTCSLFDNMPKKGWYIDDVRYKIVEGIHEYGKISCSDTGNNAEDRKRFRQICCQDISMASLQEFDLKGVQARQDNGGLGGIPGLLHRKIRNEIYYQVASAHGFQGRGNQATFLNCVREPLAVLFPNGCECKDFMCCGCCTYIGTDIVDNIHYRS